MAKASPQRQCIGCLEKNDKKEFIRIVRSVEGEYSLDETGRKNGRGAYLCKKKECLENACKRHSLDKAFKETVPASVYDSLKGEFDQLGY